MSSQSDQNKPLPSPTKIIEEDSEEQDIKQTTKGSRYWAEDNITIRCHNCKQFGHMAKECPNETKGLICILCGKEGH